VGEELGKIAAERTAYVDQSRAGLDSTRTVWQVISGGLEMMELGDSQVAWFDGTWGEYADWVTETRGPDALEPHRIKYKPLVRAYATLKRVCRNDLSWKPASSRRNAGSGSRPTPGARARGHG
jgi:hypothetical protein